MRRASETCLVLIALGGVGAAAVSGRLYFGLIGFAALLAALVLVGLSGPGESWKAPDLQRADDHEEHPMPEGPAPPGPI